MKIAVLFGVLMALAGAEAGKHRLVPLIVIRLRRGRVGVATPLLSLILSI